MAPIKPAPNVRLKMAARVSIGGGITSGAMVINRRRMSIGARVSIDGGIGVGQLRTVSSKRLPIGARLSIDGGVTVRTMQRRRHSAK